MCGVPHRGGVVAAAAVTWLGLEWRGHRVRAASSPGGGFDLHHVVRGSERRAVRSSARTRPVLRGVVARRGLRGSRQFRTRPARSCAKVGRGGGEVHEGRAEPTCLHGERGMIGAAARRVRVQGERASVQ